MNNAALTTDPSTVEVEEKDETTEVNQEVVSETEASDTNDSAPVEGGATEVPEENTNSKDSIIPDSFETEQASPQAEESTVTEQAAATIEAEVDLEEDTVNPTEPPGVAEVASDTEADSTPDIPETEQAVVPPDETATVDETSETGKVVELPDEAVAADDAIELPQEPMSPESLEEAYDNSIKAFTDGEIVKGTVVDVNRDEVMIDIGFKSEGYIPASEFGSSRSDLPPVQVGDEIDVYIVRREDAEGQIVLSKKIADQTLIWDKITRAHEEGNPIEGRITERIKGGFRVSIGSLRGFLPASQIEMRPVQNLEDYVGQTLEMKVINLSRRRHNIVLSRRAWLEAKLSKKKAEVLSTLEVGQLITGEVKNITVFGAFIDLGGVDGLLHKTDMAWKRVHHPSEIVSVGETVEALVIGIGKENEKISLGLKQKTSNPWKDVEEKYPINSTVHGSVVNIVNYGAFLHLEEGVEGLIHVSEMSWTRRNVAPSRIVSKGQEIEAVVLEISKEDKRISLGIKQLKPNPWELLEEKYPVGSKITGRIRNLTNFGVFVEIEEGIDGLIHTSDLSWTKRGAESQETLKEGSEIEVVVLHIDAQQRRVSLGLKQTQPDPWSAVSEKYKIGSVVRGKIVNITSFGAFTKLEEGIEGLIHISELAYRRIEKPEEIVSVGQELDLKVINLSPKDRRIGLSLKAAIAEQERATSPPEEKAEYIQKERPSRTRREPRRPKQIPEETVTTLGALLKKEIGKSNAGNTED